MMFRVYVTAHVYVKGNLRLIFVTAHVYLSHMARKPKNPYAVALGRKGGKKGGPARAANMTAEERSASARNAVMARWKKAKGETDG